MGVDRFCVMQRAARHLSSSAGAQWASKLRKMSAMPRFAPVHTSRTLVAPLRPRAPAALDCAQRTLQLRALSSSAQSSMTAEERRAHEEGVIEQYDSEHKRAFYAEVMGDGTDNIHFGKWDGVDTNKPGAYGQAATNMTNWMWSQAMQLLGSDAKAVHYIDLGSGSGSAAAHLCGAHPGVKAQCINLCPNQNAENMTRAKTMGLGDRIAVETGTYMEMPKDWEGKFDGCFTQDAFVHAYSKEAGLKEALRVTKPGGFLVLCDLHCGNGPDVSAQELHTFAETNMVADWLTPEEMVTAAKAAGWGNVEFVDLTPDIRLSFQLMGRKVTEMLATGKYDKSEMLPTLRTYEANLLERVTQVDRGVFKWGALLAKKPGM